tara:strand:- start:557 stop:877 length:321 start_codon:yes stop_codon:yes gene_type:complete
MNIFENIFGPAESEKIRSLEASLKLINTYIGDDAEIMNLTSHNRYTYFEGRDNIYHFTIKLLSLDFLSKLGKDKRVKNVFFAARHAPPGGGADSITLRQKILIEYH